MTLEYSVSSLEKSLATLPPTGVVDVVGFGAASSVKKLYSQYPMKLVVPHTHRQSRTKVVYIVRYGGGIAQSQVTSLKASVSCESNIVLLTRGPMKIYSDGLCQPNVQVSEINIGRNSSCLFLPDPIVCFEDSIYHQNHKFHLADSSSSLVVLDWYSSGFRQDADKWKLKSYFSSISITLNDELIARELVSLQQDLVPLVTRMSHTNMANLYVIGPHFRTLANSLLTEFQEYTLYPEKFRKQIIWTVTPLDEVDGVILKIAATETDPLRFFIRERLASLRALFDTQAMFI